MTGRPKALLELTSEEKGQLERWVRRRKSAQALALRSRFVLACASALTNKEVAAQLGVSMPTVGKWRSRFVESRLDGLVDEPRSGARRRSPLNRSRTSSWRRWNRPRSTVPAVQAGDDGAVGGFEGREQAGRAVPDVVVGAFLGHAGHHRERRVRPS
jgi:Winged helix-turn helix